MDKKKAVGEAAAALVKKGMRLGLGTGSTADEFIKALAARNSAEQLNLECVATSVKSETLASSLGLEIVSLSEINELDLAVDGADQVNPAFELIKGLGGGAICREKIVDYMAKEFVVIVDESKMVPVLNGNVPLEVIPFALASVTKRILSLGARSASVRVVGGETLVTDNGNNILDCIFGEIRDPTRMENELSTIPGVVENGVFSRNVSRVLVATESGVREEKRW